MIIEAVLSVVVSLLTALFNLLPELPAMPEIISTYWSQFVVIFNNGLSFLMFFLVPDVLYACLGISLALFIFDETYDFILWFLRKIPFLNIKQAACKFLKCSSLKICEQRFGVQGQHVPAGFGQSPKKLST